MPGVLTPAGFANVKMVFSLTGDPEQMITTFGVELDGSPDPTTLATDIFDAWITAYDDSFLSNLYTVQGCEVLVGPDSAPTVGSYYATPVTGTNTVARLPQNTAALIHKRSAVAGRHGRGRMYLPAGYLPETEVDARGTIDPNTLTNLNGASSGFLATLSSGPGTAGMVILHTAPLIAPTPVTSLNCDTIIATQRRRLRP